MNNLKKMKLLRNEQNALNEVLSMLIQKFPIKRVILFGSKARGDFDEYSDIDLLFVMDKVLDIKNEKLIVENLYEIGIKYDVLFNSLRTSVEEWNGIFKHFPIYNEIKNDGIQIL